MKKALYLYSLFLCFAFSFNANATHNRAGEITYKWIGPGLYTYKIKIITYTSINPPSNADRCYDTISFGDGSPRAAIARSNGTTSSLCQGNARDGVNINSDIRLNEYETIHTYPGPGDYIISMEDPNRNANVNNILNSVDQVFYIESLIIIPSFSSQKNSSPILTFPPIDKACVGSCFLHNPGAYDPDGDSLSYELTSCRGVNGAILGGYSDPPIGSGGAYQIDNRGTLTWCSPQQQGEYNLAFIIKEWRKNTFDGSYELIGYVLRDLQVDVSACNNNSPTIKPMADTCVLAGTVLSKLISATDPNSQVLSLEVDGGPFHVTAPIATFNANNAIGLSTGTLHWQTSCSHIRKAPYQVTIKVSDGGSPVSLVDFKTFNITVVAPAPQNLTAKPIGSNIELKWTKPVCRLTTGNRILSYCVYRKSDCNPWIPSNCEVGVPAYTGYVKIGCTASINDTLLLDTNNGSGLSQGTNYSYLVVAVYSDNAESYASNQACVQLKRDVPMLINADVQTTNATTGSVFVRWIKPRLGFNALDTTSITGPYEFRLMHHDDFTGTFNQLYSVTNNFFAGFNQLSDTTFTHTLNLNTQTLAHTYKIEFYANGQFVGNGQKGSSVFLSATPSDNKISLSWAHLVPWNNFSYDVYRKNPGQTTYTIIGITSTQSYQDNNLVNGVDYCYKVQAKGQYADPSIISPLLNFSQELCVKPIDQTPPCAPTASVAADCILHTLKLMWNNPNKSCSDDAVKYNLYFAETENDSLQLLQTFTNITDTLFALDDSISIAGCYQITAIDSFGNESLHSAKVCADNCPEYELPNVITVNGDGVNDYFKPIKNRFIKDIDLKIYNRWGSLVFETSDPKIMWDGKVIQTKQLCTEGTYFYVCQVNEIRVAGIISRALKGFVQVFHK